MNRSKFLMLCFVFILVACNNGDKKSDTSGMDSTASMKLATDSNMITAAIDSNEAAKKSFDWKGTYKAVLPCADCAGVVTEIMLHSDSTFMLSTQYLGKKDSKENMSEGKFKWLSDSIIELHEQHNNNIDSKYLVADDKLIQLDANGNQITGELSSRFILKKNKK